MTAALVLGLQRLQMCDMRGAVALSIPLPVGLPLDVTRWEQTPLSCAHESSICSPSSSTRPCRSLRSTLACRSAPAMPIVPPPPLHRRRSRQPTLFALAALATSQRTLGIARHWGRLRRSSTSSPRPAPVGRPSVPTQGPPIHPRSSSCRDPDESAPLLLGTLLPLQPDGGLVMEERVSWQVPHPWSLWQAMMTPEDRASGRREDLHTVVAARQGQIAEGWCAGPPIVDL
jgi:hypothetical protein